MSRSRHHVDLDTSATIMVRGAGGRARHRAPVDEEHLAAALAASDRERVLQFRDQLADAEGAQR